MKKKKIIKKGLAKSYCQSELNRQFSKPEFPIEEHCLNIIKIWSFSALQSFILPYSVILCILVMIIIYFATKRQLFMNYYIYRFKDLKFLRKYLIFYNFFL
jgi:hypothetical protein